MGGEGFAVDASMIVADAHRQRGVAHAESRAGRFVHLAEDQHALIEHAGRLNFPIQFLAFAAALADPAEHADAAMMADHVVNQFHDQYGLADACASEQTAFPAAFEGRQDVDGLDAGDEDFGTGGAPHKRHRARMDRAPLAALHSFFAIDSFAEDVEHAAQNAIAYRDPERLLRIGDGRAAGKASRGCQGDSSYRVRIEMRHDLHDDFAIFARMQDIQDGGNVFRKTNVDYTAPDRFDNSGIRGGWIHVSVISRNWSRGDSGRLSPSRGICCSFPWFRKPRRRGYGSRRRMFWRPQPSYASRPCSSAGLWTG